MNRKYYVYKYWNNTGCGKRWILAETEDEALKLLKQFLHKHHPFKRFTILLEQITPN
jgi:hypothetical protein